jgi:hypothetical protein
MLKSDHDHFPPITTTTRDGRGQTIRQLRPAERCGCCIA